MDGRNNTKPAMAFALFPCIIILRNQKHPMTDQWLNHEKIHVMQNFESLGLIHIISRLEYLYARYILKYDRIKAYMYQCVEQEAYLNQHDFEYLKNKRPLEIMKYIRTKRNFHTDDSYGITIDR
ncbi:hypothetical protein H6764_01075 [Candidatus Nomurabacteria bacterium]|nr:hypothetical protein [Candidatus Nomurabacteria bacterium]